MPDASGNVALYPSHARSNHQAAWDTALEAGCWGQGRGVCSLDMCEPLSAACRGLQSGCLVLSVSAPSSRGGSRLQAVALHVRFTWQLQSLQLSCCGASPLIPQWPLCCHLNLVLLLLRPDSCCTDLPLSLGVLVGHLQHFTALYARSAGLLACHISVSLPCVASLQVCLLCLVGHQRPATSAVHYNSCSQHGCEHAGPRTL